MQQSVESGFDAFDRDGRAISSDFIHEVGDLTCVEAHGEHCISTDLMGGETKSLDSLESAIRQQFGVTLHLTTKKRAKTGAGVGKSVTCTHGDTEHLAMNIEDSVAGQIRSRHHDDRRARVNRRDTANFSGRLLRNDGLNLIGPCQSVPPTQLCCVGRICVPTRSRVAPRIFSHALIVRRGDDQ